MQLPGATNWLPATVLLIAKMVSQAIEMQMIRHAIWQR